MTEKIYDVIQIGYGPVSQSLALMLGRQGRSVATFERWGTPYPLPRAVCIDHEIYRVLSANGMGDVMPSVSHKGTSVSVVQRRMARIARDRLGGRLHIGRNRGQLCSSTDTGARSECGSVAPVHCRDLLWVGGHQG